jgi:hypothetical protein
MTDDSESGRPPSTVRRVGMTIANVDDFKCGARSAVRRHGVLFLKRELWPHIEVYEDLGIDQH